MAIKKRKTKEIPFGNTATEVKPDVWDFTTGGILWRWSKNMGGVYNFGPVSDGDIWHAVLSIKTLDQAGVFAEGFAAGMARARNSSLTS